MHYLFTLLRAAIFIQTLGILLSHHPSTCNFLGQTYGKSKFPAQGLEPCHSSDMSHCSDNARSLTRYTTRELQHIIF